MKHLIMFLFYSFMTAWFFRGFINDFRDDSLFTSGLNLAAVVAFSLSAAVEYIKW